MNEESFREYLSKNNIEEEQISVYIKRLNDFQEFLNREEININSIPEGKIVEYTEYFVNKGEDKVLDVLRALINYANFTENYDYTIEIIDIVEGYNAMDNLYTRIAEQIDEETRDEIFNELTIPPLGVHPDKKPTFTKEIMKRMEEKIG